MNTNNFNYDMAFKYVDTSATCLKNALQNLAEYNAEVQQVTTTLNEKVETLERTVENYHKDRYVLNKRLKSLIILLTKDSIKNMNEEQLKDIISNAGVMANQLKSIVEKM